MRTVFAGRATVAALLVGVAFAQEVVDVPAAYLELAPPALLADYQAFAARLDERERRGLSPASLAPANAMREFGGEEIYVVAKDLYFAVYSDLSHEAVLDELRRIPDDVLFSPPIVAAIDNIRHFTRVPTLHVDPTPLESAMENYFFARYESAPEPHRRPALELALSIPIGQIERARSCDAACRAEFYLDLLDKCGGKPILVTSDRIHVRNRLQGVACPPCEGMAARVDERTPVRRYLTAWEYHFGEARFVAREEEMYGRYVMVSGKLPVERRELLSELVLMQLGEAPPKAIARRVAALPVDVLADRELEGWFLGAVPPSGDLKWWRERNRLVEEVFVGKYLENPAQPALLDRAVALCQYAVDDRETGLDCAAAARMANYIEEYEAAHGPYPVAARRARAREWKAACSPATSAP